jgi:signal transduction histidine kinase
VSFRSAEATAKATLDEQLGNAIVNVREVMDNLSPMEIEHIGLRDAIESCLERGARRSSYKLRFRSEVPAEALNRLSKIEQLLLYRLVQETVNNICKHAGAKTVVAEIASKESALVVSIMDDGIGIDPELFAKESRGMRYMRQRANLIRGTVAWKAGEHGKGVTVEIKVFQEDVEKS